MAWTAFILSFFGCLCLPSIVAFILGLVVLKFQARAKQAECKTHLKTLYTAQRAYFQEQDRYSEDLQEIGFVPDPPRWYSYFVSRTAEPIVAAENPVRSLEELPHKKHCVYPV